MKKEKENSEERNHSKKCSTFRSDLPNNFALLLCYDASCLLSAVRLTTGMTYEYGREGLWSTAPSSIITKPGVGTQRPEASGPASKLARRVSGDIR